MKITYFLISLLILVNLSYSAPIVDLDDSNFTNYTLDHIHNYTLLLAHTSWCEECKDLLKEFEKVNDFISTLDPPRYLARINMDNENATEQTQDRLKINAIPSIYMAVKGFYREYKGPYTTQSIITFVLKFAGKSIYELETEEEIKDMINPQTTYMSIFCFDKSYNRVISKIAITFNHGLFGKSKDNSDSLKTYFQPKGDFIILKSFEPNKLYERLDFNFTTVEQMTKTLYLNSIPIVAQFSHFAIDIIFKQEIPAVCFMEKKKNKDIETFKKFAYDYYATNHEFLSFTLDSLNAKDNELLQIFGFDEDDFDNNELFVIDFPTKQFAIYRMKSDKESISLEKMNDFWVNVKSRLIEKEKRSEAVPKSQPKENLITVVAKTFNREILKNDKNGILLAYIIANCDKCDLIQDIFDTLSSKYTQQPQLRFALIDPVFNDIPEFEMPKPFSPVIHYYPIDKSQGSIVYNGELNSKKINDFLKNQGIVSKHMKKHEL